MQNEICTRLFTPALFVRAKDYKQLKCPNSCATIVSHLKTKMNYCEMQQHETQNDRNQTQKNTVNTLQLKTTRNIAVVEHVEFITPLSKGTHTPWKCGMSQEKSIRKDSHDFG